MMSGWGALATNLSGALNAGQDRKNRQTAMAALGLGAPVDETGGFNPIERLRAVFTPEGRGALPPAAAPSEAPGRPPAAGNPRGALSTTLRPEARPAPQGPSFTPAPAVGSLSSSSITTAAPALLTTPAPPQTPGAQPGGLFPRAMPASLVTSESGGNWNALNSLGYGGRMQAGDDRLLDAARAGVIPQMTGAQYSQQPREVQEKVEAWHFGQIADRAQAAGLDRYIGQEIGGVVVTGEGISAMAHLGGFNGARRFLESGGRYDPQDGNGTNLSEYLRTHGAAGASAAPPSGSSPPQNGYDTHSGAYPVPSDAYSAPVEDPRAALLAQIMATPSGGTAGPVTGGFAGGLAAGLDQGQARKQRKAAIDALGAAGPAPSMNPDGTPAPVTAAPDIDWTPYVAGAAASRPDSITSLTPEFQGSLGALMQAAQSGPAAGLTITSGFRSNERQQQLFDAAVAKYGSPEAARRWVAPPGRSQHNHGAAVDLSWNGQRLDAAPPEVREWVHQNAATYGLTFPMSWEPWHIEPVGARATHH